MSAAQFSLVSSFITHRGVYVVPVLLSRAFEHNIPPTPPTFSLLFFFKQLDDMHLLPSLPVSRGSPEHNL